MNRLVMCFLDTSWKASNPPLGMFHGTAHAKAKHVKSCEREKGWSREVSFSTCNSCWFSCRGPRLESNGLTCEFWLQEPCMILSQLRHNSSIRNNILHAHDSASLQSITAPSVALPTFVWKCRKKIKETTCSWFSVFWSKNYSRKEVVPRLSDLYAMSDYNEGEEQEEEDNGRRVSRFDQLLDDFGRSFYASPTLIGREVYCYFFSILSIIE